MDKLKFASAILIFDAIMLAGCEDIGLDPEWEKYKMNRDISECISENVDNSKFAPNQPTMDFIIDYCKSLYEEENQRK